MAEDSYTKPVIEAVVSTAAPTFPSRMYWNILCTWTKPTEQWSSILSALLHLTLFRYTHAFYITIDTCTHFHLTYPKEYVACHHCPQSPKLNPCSKNYTVTAGSWQVLTIFLYGSMGKPSAQRRWDIFTTYSWIVQMSSQWVATESWRCNWMNSRYRYVAYFRCPRT